ncbi:MAG TPA: type II secretion system protein [Actinomycetota bacterium]|nr:type II secretion system protein [Actinomycetota bacterium]
MRWNESLFIRLHARVRDDERGFSLLETVIAITVIFGSLITLALSASTGFRYVGIGREQQAANQIANQLMEQTRGLAFSKIQRGLQASGLSTDPNLVTGCTGDASGVYHLIDCSGEKVVSTNLNCPTQSTDCSVPIVPSTGTVGETQDYPVDYTWHSYVTNDCPAVSVDCATISPYRVTIIVTWEGAGTSADGVQGVTTQSLFHSPGGCINSSTHPFAAPCQPFYYGQAIAPSGEIEVSGTVGAVDFQSGTIITTGVETTMQVEQVSQVQGSWSQSQTNLTTGSGTSVLPAAASFGATAVDSDPSATTPNYQVSPVDPGEGSNQFAYGGDSYVQVQNASGDSGQAISATAAGGSNACPPVPPAVTQESDLQPCGGAKVQQAGVARVVAYLYQDMDLDTNPDLELGGTALASIEAPSVATTAFTDRELVSDEDGNIENSASRTLGTVSVGGLPEYLAEPAGWEGSFVELTGYSDSVSTAAGTSAAAPTTSITGTLSYWDGGVYSTIDLGATPEYLLSGLELLHQAEVTDSDSVVHQIEVRIATVDSIGMGSIPATSVSTMDCDLTAHASCTSEARATVGSPIIGSFTYELWVDGAQTVDLLIDVSFGSLASKSIYGPTPEAG